MSMFSKFIDKVLPGAPMKNITENTTDKWIKPEDKDMLESIAVAAFAPAVLNNIGSFLGGDIGSQVGDLANFAKTKTGQAIGGALTTGDIKGAATALLTNALTGGLNDLGKGGDFGKIIKQIGDKLGLPEGKNSLGDIAGMLGINLGSILPQDLNSLQDLQKTLGISGTALLPENANSIGDIFGTGGTGGTGTGSGSDSSNLMQRLLANAALAEGVNLLTQKEQANARDAWSNYQTDTTAAEKALQTPSTDIQTARDAINAINPSVAALTSNAASDLTRGANGLSADNTAYYNALRNRNTLSDQSVLNRLNESLGAKMSTPLGASLLADTLQNQGINRSIFEGELADKTRQEQLQRESAAASNLGLAGQLAQLPLNLESSVLSRANAQQNALSQLGNVSQQAANTLAAKQAGLTAMGQSVLNPPTSAQTTINTTLDLAKAVNGGLGGTTTAVPTTGTNANGTITGTPEQLKARQTILDAFKNWKPTTSTDTGTNLTGNTSDYGVSTGQTPAYNLNYNSPGVQSAMDQFNQYFDKTKRTASTIY